MKPVKTYIGIDLAVKARNTGICIINEYNTKLRIEKFPKPKSFFSKTLDFVADSIRKYILSDTEIIIAIDSPFGWPYAFKKALSRHQVRNNPFDEDLEKYLY